MNSLEWINKQILFVKQNIQYHKDLLAESEEEYANEIISAIKLLEPELQTLQQIKAELEAWKIVEEKQVDIFYINICKNVSVYNEYKPRLKNLTNKEFEIIKKTLEVKEDENKHNS